MSERPVCKHCGVEVSMVNFALGPRLMHDPYPQRSSSMYWHCQRTVAETEKPGEAEKP